MIDFLKPFPLIDSTLLSPSFYIPNERELMTRILRGQGLLDEGRTLRARNRDLESFKVGEVGARFLTRNLLAPSARRPLTRNVRALHRRFERGAIASALDVDLQVGDRHTAETDHITLHARGVNEHLYYTKNDVGQYSLSPSQSLLALAPTNPSQTPSHAHEPLARARMDA